MSESFERLKQAMLENGEALEEAESLAQAAHFLDKLPIEARAEHQRNLAAVLSAYVPRPKTRRERLREWYPAAVLTSQARVIRGEIWAASALVMLIGVLVTLFTPSLNLLSMLAPIAAAAGVALLYDDDSARVLELEASTRTSKSSLLLARLTLVFGFNLVLALLGSVVLSIFRAEFVLMPLVLSWLAPMAFLSALAFLLSVLLVDTLASAAVSLLLWALHQILKSQSVTNELLILLSMRGLSDPSNRPMLFITAAILVAAAILVVEFHERSIGAHR